MDKNFQENISNDDAWFFCLSYFDHAIENNVFGYKKGSVQLSFEDNLRFLDISLYIVPFFLFEYIVMGKWVNKWQ